MIQKNYTDQEEQIARFAKAMGHPARMAILRFLAAQDSCFFGDIRGAANCKGDRIAAPQRVERCRIDTRRNRNAESPLLYQPCELGGCAQPFRRFLPQLQNQRFLLRISVFLWNLFVVRRTTFNKKQTWRSKYWERGAPDARHSTKR